MTGLLNTDGNIVLEKCLEDARKALVSKSVNAKSAKLTFASLTRFRALSDEKPTPAQTTPLKEAVVRTGAYYFGPMFVLNKGTSVPSFKILQELSSKGFLTEPLKHMNNAQLNLFFITLKCSGLVSDKQLIGYVKYGV